MGAGPCRGLCTRPGSVGRDGGRGEGRGEGRTEGHDEGRGGGRDPSACRAHPGALASVDGIASGSVIVVDSDCGYGGVGIWRDQDKTVHYWCKIGLSKCKIINKSNVFCPVLPLANPRYNNCQLNT